jgi:Flp pilus assembly protein TadG
MPATTNSRLGRLRAAAHRTLRERMTKLDQRGVSALVVVLLTTALFSVAGLVIDGGYALSARKEAMTQAQQAARAGADALSIGALRDGTVRVDPDRAAAAARSYLRSVGADGTVAVNGGEVRVTVTSTSDTVMLSAVGVSSLPVEVSATAESIDEND